MMPNMFRVHFMAECEDCDWQTGDYLDGPRRASDHAKNHGHKVTGESGYAHTYDHRGTKPTTKGEQGT